MTKATSKFKLYWLAKRKDKYLEKMNRAFFKVRKEIIDYIKSVEGEPSMFVRYLSTCIGTSDLPTFLKIMDGIIEDAQKVKDDPEAQFAIRFCKYAVFRIHWLSNFTMLWTNVRIKCNHCHNIVPMNFCYTDKICPICGAIVLKNKETTNGK